jgi:hypothetical protein
MINEDGYAFSDVSINFSNPGQTIAVRKMNESRANLSWNGMRNQWLYIDPFNFAREKCQIFLQVYVTGTGRSNSSFL